MILQMWFDDMNLKYLLSAYAAVIVQGRASDKLMLDHYDIDDLNGFAFGFWLLDWLWTWIGGTYFFYF